MEGTKLIVCFICFTLLGRGGLSVPVPDGWNIEQLQKLEHRIEALTEEVKLREEENHHRSRRAAITVLNENRKLKLRILLPL